jgi:hypothetical protein
VTEADLAAYHDIGWLPGGVLSSTTDLEFSMIDKTIIACFEFDLMAGLGLPPSKFLILILNYLRCELVHLNPNAITTLNCFSMMCECWLRIPPDNSLFCYFYYPACYDKQDFSGIGLMLRHHCQKEYLNAKFMGSWNGTSQKWFHIDIHTEPQWTNKHLLPPHVEDKRKEPEMTPRLKALVKRVIELRQADLEACHYIEEFTLWRICPLGHREKLAFYCS